MLICFQLFPKGSDSPARMSEIDSAMCAHFGQPEHAEWSLEGWFDIIGYLLATGRTFEETKARLIELDIQGSVIQLTDICDWLSENYTTSSFYQVGR